MSNQYPYNTWTVITPAPDQNGYVWRDYDFSSTCTLSIKAFQNLNSISAYPNPVMDMLWFDNPYQIKIDKAEIYNMFGQKISTFSKVGDFIEVEPLNAGVYFVKVFSEKSEAIFKILKK